VRKVASSTVWLACGLLACTDSSKGDSAGAAGGDGGGTIDSGVRQRPPSAPVISIFPPDPVTSDDLTWQVDEAPVDPDGDALTWFVAWFADGAPATDFTDSVPAEETLKGQVWEVRATVTDGTYTSETAIDVVVIGNTPPVAQALLTPESPTTLDRLRVSPSSIDPDEADAIGYSIVWSVDGVEAGLTGLDVDPSSTTEGEVWTVEVTPVDPDGAGEVATASVTIENSLPLVDSVEIGPDDPTTNDDVEAVFAAHDPDDADVLTPIFEWTVDGSVVGTDATLSRSLYRRDQVIGLSVAMHDGTVEGPARFADSVVVNNSAPSIVGADLDPAAPDTADDVTCIPRGWSDADGDVAGYTYQWTLDGVMGSTSNHWHLGTSGASAGQTLTCTVVPDDGLDPGAPVSVSVTLSAG